jgi:hypothetical protein
MNLQDDMNLLLSNLYYLTVYSTLFKMIQKYYSNFELLFDETMIDDSVKQYFQCSFNFFQYVFIIDCLEEQLLRTIIPFKYAQ